MTYSSTGIFAQPNPRLINSFDKPISDHPPMKIGDLALSTNATPQKPDENKEKYTNRVELQAKLYSIVAGKYGLPFIFIQGASQDKTHQAIYHTELTKSNPMKIVDNQGCGSRTNTLVTAYNAEQFDENTKLTNLVIPFLSKNLDSKSLDQFKSCSVVTIFNNRKDNTRILVANIQATPDIDVTKAIATLIQFAKEKGCAYLLTGSFNNKDPFNIESTRSKMFPKSSLKNKPVEKQFLYHKEPQITYTTYIGSTDYVARAVPEALFVSEQQAKKELDQWISRIPTSFVKGLCPHGLEATLSTISTTSPKDEASASEAAEPPRPRSR